MSKLKFFSSNTTGRYVTIGVFVYVIELVIILLAQELGASPTVAVAFGFWIGLIVSFFLQKLVTFRDRRMHKKILLPQIIAVVCLVLFNFGFTVLATELLLDSLPVLVIRTLVLGATTIWNFYLYKTRIFKNTDIQLID